MAMPLPIFKPHDVVDTDRVGESGESAIKLASNDGITAVYSLADRPKSTKSVDVTSSSLVNIYLYLLHIYLITCFNNALNKQTFNNNNNNKM